MPQDFLTVAIAPAMKLLPPKMDFPAAHAMILACCLQETDLRHRRQIGGSARGYAQFELHGEIAEVLRHRASAESARAMCRALDIPPSPSRVYQAIEYSDVLAAAFARLLLWRDPEPLPRDRGEGSRARGWAIYARMWKPGHPRPEKWPEAYAQAWEAVEPTRDGGGVRMDNSREV